MENFFEKYGARADRDTLEKCGIFRMLRENAGKRHLSFHTPGHKIGAWDITELSFSDNLSCPRGAIDEAEKDIAGILGATASFILTDGSTSGVFSMLRASGAKTVALSARSHKSVFHACGLLGIRTVFIDAPCGADGIPSQPSPEAAAKVLFPCGSEEGGDGTGRRRAEKIDAVLLTSPDYYGNIADLAAIRALCDKAGALLLVDGAHGGHLHFCPKLYAGSCAHLWVDGVHKSLPALTQGAVVSAATEELAARLRDAVDVFRTTSPSYPIMASVEYAVKYPRNAALEKEVFEFFLSRPDRLYCGGDWTKLCALFGGNAFEAMDALEREGVYAEFCDGNLVMFYLSPATEKGEFYELKSRLLALFDRLPYRPIELKYGEQGRDECGNDGRKDEKNDAGKDGGGRENGGEKERNVVALFPDEAAGKICARPCGLFPPCTPLIFAGERISEEKIDLLRRAANVYGLIDGKILVFDR